MVDWLGEIIKWEKYSISGIAKHEVYTHTSTTRQGTIHIFTIFFGLKVLYQIERIVQSAKFVRRKLHPCHAPPLLLASRHPPAPVWKFQVCLDTCTPTNYLGYLTLSKHYLLLKLKLFKFADEGLSNIVKVYLVPPWPVLFPPYPPRPHPPTPPFFLWEILNFLVQEVGWDVDEHV